MLTDDQNPGMGGAEEAVDLTGEGQTVPSPQSGDPLDDIKDPDARADAKKHRAIARRNAGREDTPPATPAAPQVNEYVSKTDIARIATQQAKEMVSEEVRDQWDELTSIPLAGYDALDAKSIARNMTDRLAILAARKGTPKSHAGAGLQTMAMRGTAGSTTSAPAAKQPPNLKLPTQPAEWYPKD